MAYASEYLIEAAAERKMDALDRAYGRGDLTTKENNELVRELEMWCDDEYRKLKGRANG